MTVDLSKLKRGDTIELRSGERHVVSCVQEFMGETLVGWDDDGKKRGFYYRSKGGRLYPNVEQPMDIVSVIPQEAKDAAEALFVGLTGGILAAPETPRAHIVPNDRCRGLIKEIEGVDYAIHGRDSSDKKEGFIVMHESGGVFVHEVGLTSIETTLNRSKAKIFSSEDSAKLYIPGKGWYVGRAG